MEDCQDHNHRVPVIDIEIKGIKVQLSNLKRNHRKFPPEFTRPPSFRTLDGGAAGMFSDNTNKYKADG